MAEIITMSELLILCNRQRRRKRGSPGYSPIVLKVIIGRIKRALKQEQTTEQEQKVYRAHLKSFQNWLYRYGKKRIDNLVTNANSKFSKTLTKINKRLLKKDTGPKERAALIKLRDRTIEVQAASINKKKILRGMNREARKLHPEDAIKLGLRPVKKISSSDSVIRKAITIINGLLWKNIPPGKRGWISPQKRENLISKKKKLIEILASKEKEAESFEKHVQARCETIPSEIFGSGKDGKVIVPEGTTLVLDKNSIESETVEVKGRLVLNGHRVLSLKGTNIYKGGSVEPYNPYSLETIRTLTVGQLLDMAEAIKKIFFKEGEQE